MKIESFSPRGFMARFFFLAACLTLLALFFSFDLLRGMSAGAEKGRESHFSIPAEREFWERKIEQKGASVAYGEFTEAFAGREVDVQHVAAHLMGDVLYRKLGINGLAVCDPSFGFGCYHQFFASVLSEESIDVLPKLDEACIVAYGPLGTGCQHGIGHGLVEHFGYTEEALLEELAACGRTTIVNDLFGCSSGVFMQYNVPILFDGEYVETKFREFSPKEPTAPCPLVPDSFKRSCYFSLPQWWLGASGHDFERTGRLCLEVPTEYREACYLGVGNVAAPQSSYDVSQTIGLCEMMPSREGEITCRSSASWAFFSRPESMAAAPLLCEGLREAELGICREKSDLIGNGEIFSTMKIQ